MFTSQAQGTHTMSPADLRGHVRLACVPGIGSRLRRLLLERFGTPEGVFAASPTEIASVGRISHARREPPLACRQCDRR